MDLKFPDGNLSPAKDDTLLVAGAPTICSRCGAPLCLRKQVMNLAIGNIEKMACLNCLAKESGQTAPAVLQGLESYIERRDCFKNQWRRYLNHKYCPDKANCYPETCFKQSIHDQ